MKSTKESWFKIREFIFLALLSAEIILRLIERTRLDMKTPAGYTLVAIELFWIPVALGALYVTDVMITGIRSNLKKMCIDGFIGVFFIISAYTSCDFYLLATGAFLVCSDKASLKNIAKVVAASLIFGTVVIGALSQVGFIDDKLFNRFGRTAHSFGFRHYAFPARQLLFGWCAYLYFKTKKVSWPEHIVYFIAGYLVYYFTTQRLTLVVFILVWVLYIVFVKYELIKIDTLFIKICSIIAFPVCGIVSVVITYLYDSSVSWMKQLDKLVNTRLSVGTIAFDRYDINLFGQYVLDTAPGSAEGYFYMDCGYLDVLMSHGVILFVIALVICSVMYLYSCYKKDTMLFVWMSCILVYTVVDCVWLDTIGAGTGVIIFGAILGSIRQERKNI